MLRLLAEPQPGDSINDTASAMCRIAAHLQTNITCKFNGCLVSASPSTHPHHIINRYHDWLRRPPLPAKFPSACSIPPSDGSPAMSTT